MPDRPPTPPPLLTRGLLLVCGIGFAAMTSFYLLLSAVPVHAAGLAPGREESVAGLCTGALMLATVLAELAAPALLDRAGPRVAMLTAALLLGVPALALPLLHTLPLVLLVCLVRGAGLGVLVVVVGAQVAGIASPERRGEALGLFGAVVTVPAVAALPLGVWIGRTSGFSSVFVAGGLAALVAAGLAPLLPGRGDRLERTGVLAVLRRPEQRRPALVFTATTVAAGVVVTFVPLAVGTSATIVSTALLVQALTATVGRWWSGRVGDRHGPRILLLPGVLAAAAGLGGLALGPHPATVLTAMAVFGAGFGVIQNATVALMFARTTPAGHGAVSGVWNLAYDAGLGAGALGFGAVVGWTGYPAGFVLVAVLVCAVVPLTGRDRRPVPVQEPAR